MKIEEGKTYLCTRTYALQDGRVLFTKSKKYVGKSMCGLISDEGWLVFVGYTGDYFEEVKQNESKKVKINIPKDCDVKDINTSVEDGYIVVEYTPEKKFIPKDGDIVCAEAGLDGDPRLQRFIFIYGDITRPNLMFNVLKSGKWSLNDKSNWTYDILRLATEEEKQMLFEALAKKGKRWNAEKKEIENIRWRAKPSGYYYFVGSCGTIWHTHDYYNSYDNQLYELGNYFESLEEAQVYADKFKQLFKERL